jgi:hypothetical protein
MSRFCVKCGQPAGENIVFCTSCGTRLQTAELTAQAAASAGALPAKKASAKPAHSGKGKVILPVAGGIILLAGLVVGTVAYAGCRATSTAKQLTQGHDLGAILNETRRSTARQSYATPTKSAAGRDACSLVSKEEVAKATGTNISEATLSDESVCTYEPGDDSSVTIVVDIKWRDGDLAMRALPGFSKQFGQDDIRHPVKGIGDEAYLLGVDEQAQKDMDSASPDLKALTGFATGPVVFRKGEVWVVVTATLSENKSEVEKRIAAILAARI